MQNDGYWTLVQYARDRAFSRLDTGGCRGSMREAKNPILVTCFRVAQQHEKLLLRLLRFRVAGSSRGRRVFITQHAHLALGKWERHARLSDGIVHRRRQIALDLSGLVELARPHPQL